MNTLVIIRNIEPNFKNSTPEIKIANSHVHLSTSNIEEGIEVFNKLKVASEIFLLQSAEYNKHFYHKLAEKSIISESDRLRVLQTTVENIKFLKSAKNQITTGKEEIHLPI